MRFIVVPNRVAAFGNGLVGCLLFAGSVAAGMSLRASSLLDAALLFGIACLGLFLMHGAWRALRRRAPVPRIVAAPTGLISVDAFSRREIKWSDIVELEPRAFRRAGYVVVHYYDREKKDVIGPSQLSIPIGAFIGVWTFAYGAASEIVAWLDRLRVRGAGEVNCVDEAVPRCVRVIVVEE